MDPYAILGIAHDATDEQVKLFLMALNTRLITADLKTIEVVFFRSNYSDYACACPRALSSPVHPMSFLKMLAEQSLNYHLYTDNMQV